MEDNAFQSSDVSECDVIYVKGEDEEAENFPCKKFSQEVTNIDYTVIGAHISGNCTKPYVKVRLYSDLPIGDRERDGYLTDRMIEVCSCCLDMTAIPGKYALSMCILEKKGLRNIEILGYHQYLKHLNLSGNCIESVEVIGKLPFLEYLDVSHNLLTKLADFKAPINLSHLNYSYNLIEEMEDLEEFWGLVYLDVSHNLITKIFGLNKLKYLNYIDLSYNRIERLENINNLNIQTLILDFNNLNDFEFGKDVGLRTLLRVSHISATNNLFESLKFLKGIRTVESIDVSDNDIKDLFEITYLKQMPYLMSLNILGNPVVENSKFKIACFNTIKRLDVLNGKTISVEEKGELKFMARKTPDGESGHNNIIIETLNHQKRLEIDSTVIPCYQKFASMILLVGPMSSKRERVLTNILESNPVFAKKGVSHTTRPQSGKEIHGRDYYFISDEEFKKLLLEGKFICCSHKYGYSYGLSYDEIRKISEAIGILFINCDVTSALQIKSKFLNCKLVLSLPKSEKSHTNYLQEKFTTSLWIHNYLEGYVIGYKSSMKKSSTNAVIAASDFFNMEPNMPKKEDTLISILRSQPKMEKKEQTVSFNNPRTQYPSSTSHKSEFNPRSVSQALMPGHRISFPLSSVSMETFQSIVKSSLCSSTCPNVSSNMTPTSASRAVTVNESLILTEASDGNIKDGVSSKKLPDISFDNMKASHLEKYFEVSSHFLNASTDVSNLLISVSQAVKEQDEYILSVLLSRANTCDSFDSDSTDFVDSFRRTESNSNNSLNTTETDTMLLDYFIETQLMRRKLYLQLYDRYPGLFYTIINTDKSDNACRKLTDILKTCVEMQNKHIFVSKTQCKNIYVCKEMRDAKLKMMFDAIN